MLSLLVVVVVVVKGEVAMGSNATGNPLDVSSLLSNGYWRQRDLTTKNGHVEAFVLFT